jgi:hypothetical protein
MNYSFAELLDLGNEHEIIRSEEDVPPGESRRLRSESIAPVIPSSEAHLAQPHERIVDYIQHQAGCRRSR